MIEIINAKMNQIRNEEFNLPLINAKKTRRDISCLINVREFGEYMTDHQRSRGKEYGRR